MSIHVPAPYNPARIWTDDDFAQFKRLAKLRLSSGEIGFQVGRTKASIEGMCARRGIPLPGGTAESPIAREHQKQRDAAHRARMEHKMHDAALASIRTHCRMLGVKMPERGA